MKYVFVTIKRVREMVVYVAMEVALYRNGPNSDGVDDTFSDKSSTPRDLLQLLAATLKPAHRHLCMVRMW